MQRLQLRVEVAELSHARSGARTSRGTRTSRCSRATSSRSWRARGSGPARRVGACSYGTSMGTRRRPRSSARQLRHQPRQVGHVLEHVVGGSASTLPARRRPGRPVRVDGDAAALRLRQVEHQVGLGRASTSTLQPAALVVLARAELMRVGLPRRCGARWRAPGRSRRRRRAGRRRPRPGRRAEARELARDLARRPASRSVGEELLELVGLEPEHAVLERGMRPRRGVRSEITGVPSDRQCDDARLLEAARS